MRNLVFIFVTLVVITFITQSTMAQNLVLYLPFDEGSGTTVKDLSGNGNNGIVNGAIKWTDGKVNKAIQFNGKSFVDIPNSDSLSPNQNITVMAWVNMDKASSGEMAIISKGQWAANDLPYELTVNQGNKIYWQMYDGVGGHDQCSPNSPAAGEWHHIAGYYDGKTFKCYIDGVNVMEAVYAGKLPINTASVTVGKRSKADECYFTGTIDEVAIFASALTDQQIKDAMNGIKAAPVDSKEKLPALWGKIKSE
jgi:hypothetical protein